MGEGLNVPGVPSIGGEGLGGVIAAIGASPPAALVDYFAADVATSAWYGDVTYTNALHDVVSSSSFVGHEAWNGAASVREARVQAFDPATMTLKSAGVSWQVNSALIDDDHGVPSLEIDYQGYLHCMGGNHNGPLQYSVSANPRDASAWNAKGAFGTKYTYPHLLATDAGLVGLFRVDFGPNGGGSVNKMTGVYKKTTSLAGGAAAWGPDITYVDMGSDANGTATGAGSRWYLATTVIKDGVLYGVGTFADYGDSYRQDVYFFGIDLSTGDLLNVDKSVRIPAASLPVNRATLRASFMAVDQQTTGHYGAIPSFTFDASGAPNVLFMDGTDTGGVGSPTSPYAVRHTVFSNGAWSAPITLGQTPQRYDAISIARSGTGLVALFCTANANTAAVTGVSDTTLNSTGNLPRGGDISSCSYGNGAWSTPALVYAASPEYNLDRPIAVRNAHPALTHVFAETAQFLSNSAPNCPTTKGGNLRAFGYGSAGIAKVTFQPRAETQAYVSRMTVAPPAALLTALDEMIGSLINLGIWAGLDVFYPMALHDAGAALLNAKGSPYTLTPSSTAPVFTAGRGFKGDGAAAYMDTGFSPGAAAPAASETTASLDLFMWNLTDGQSDSAEVGGVQGSGGALTLGARNTAGAAFARAADSSTQGANINKAVTSAVGLLSVRRPATNARLLYKDGALLSNDAVVAGSFPTGNINLFRNVGGTTTFSTRQLAIVGAGTSIGTVNQGVLYNVLRRFLLSVGAAS